MGNELAFYGGSFTCLPISLQESYLRQTAAAMGAGLIRGIRLSTRPDGISAPVLSLLKRYDVGTVELGIQSMDDGALRLSRRGHTALQSVEAVLLLKDSGFRTGVQLMPGLPGADAESDMTTVRKVIDLAPHMVRIYPTVVVKGTDLHQMYMWGEYQPISLEKAVPLCAEMLLSFQAVDIPVIRLGLQQTARLERGAVIAGPHHPALRHLVESHIFRCLAERALKSLNAQGGVAVFTVSPRNLSNLRGQKNQNRRTLMETFALQRLDIGARPELEDDALLLEWEDLSWKGKTTDLLGGASIDV